MRIAYITYEYPPDYFGGGIATYVAQASRMMARRGHEVEVFASSPSRSGRFESDGVLEHRIREANLREFGVVAGHRFATRHAERPFDVLEGPEYGADARKAVELVPDIPLVVKMHTPSLMGANLNEPPGFRRNFRNLGRSVRGLAKSLVRRTSPPPFLFTSPAMQDARNMDKVEAGHARGASIVAPPCRDLCRYARTVWNIPEAVIRLSPHPYTPNSEFLALQPKAGRFTVGFVGRLERRKGIETLAAAMPAILEAAPEATFRFIGRIGCHPDTGLSYDRWYRNHMPKSAGRLEFTGGIPPAAMAQAYDGLDVCVFPSLWENFPNVCLEAMAAARAIVASSAGGMSEQLDHGRVGRLMAPRDAAALAREVLSLREAPSERIRLGAAARARVLDSYNDATIGGLMENIYREAIAIKAGAGPVRV